VPFSSLTIPSDITDLAPISPSYVNGKLGVYQRNVDQLNTDLSTFSATVMGSLATVLPYPPSGNTQSFGTYAVSGSTASFLGAFLPTVSTSTLLGYSGNTISHGSWAVSASTLSALYASVPIASHDSIGAYSRNTVSLGTWGLSVTTIAPQSGNTTPFVGAISTNTIQPGSGNTLIIPSHISMGNTRIENLGEPSGTSDGATKHYVDAATGAAAKYDTQSKVSAAANGSLLFTSDTSNLFGTPSNGTVLIGGSNAILNIVFPGTVPQRQAWYVEAGSVQAAGGASSVTVTFSGSGFSANPVILSTRDNEGKAESDGYLWINGLSTTQVGFAGSSHTGAPLQTFTVHWMAFGKRAL